MRDGSRSVPISGGERACAALRATRLRDPKTLVLAVPVAPTENLAAMREDADDVVCLENHARFRATGFGGAWKLSMASAQPLIQFRQLEISHQSHEPLILVILVVAVE